MQMSYKVQSATPLEAVMVAGGQVWLRKNISAESGFAYEGECAPYTAYVADEVSFFDPSVTKEYAKENFDALWEAAETLSLAPKPYADRLSAANSDAIADLSGSVSDNASAVIDLSDAIADLSQTVSDFKGGA